MSDKSRIEWTEATWNPISGCTKVSPGCHHCYAERMWKRLSAPNMPYEGRAFTDVQCHPERLDQPLRWKKPRRIFVNSMSDLFHEDVPTAFINQVFAVMALCQQHTFQILTKRPERMREFFSDKFRENIVKGTAWEILGHYPKHSSAGMKAEWPLPNVHLGVSCEDQATADDRIPPLVETPAAIKFISAEPLLGPVDLSPWLMSIDPQRCGLMDDPLACALMNQSLHDGSGDGVRCLDWVIVGGESGPKARPMHPDWVRSIRDQCQAAGTAFFFKQWGEWLTSSQGAVDNAKTVQRGDHTGKDIYFKVGKKAAGRLLDGREWSEYPA